MQPDPAVDSPAAPRRPLPVLGPSGGAALDTAAGPEGPIGAPAQRAGPDGAARQERLRDRVRQLPQTPGVYLWKDDRGEVLYVGKAKRLRARVSSYWRTPAPTPRHAALMERVADLEVMHTPTEADALVLEARLIQHRRPRFNVALVEGGGAPWVAITLNEPFPRVLLRRRPLHDGAEEIGPWTNPAHLRDVLQVVRERFPVRSCSWALPTSAPDRPCLDYHLKRCMAPCVGRQTRESYAQIIHEVRLVLQGRSQTLLAELRTQMHDAAAAWRFERAAVLRDQIAALEAAPTPGHTLTGLQVSAPVDADVFGVAREQDEAVVVWLQVRDGAVLGAQTQIVEQATWSTDAEVLAAVLAGPWARLTPARGAGELAERPRTTGLATRAATVVLPPAIAWGSVAPAALDGPPPQARLPRGPWRAVSETAMRQARQVLDDLQLAEARILTRTDASVAELQHALALPAPPRRLVGFDIAHYSGKGTVAAAVRFENGAVHRAGVRTFRIRTVEGVDDFASMREAVLRWGLRVADGKEEGVDLVLIDGGPQQLAMAVEALAAAGLEEIPVVALAKREELIYRPGGGDPLHLPRQHRGLQLLQQVRDEAHRVGGRHLRQGTAKTLRTSRLQHLPGIGPTLAKRLLARFGSLDGVRRAAVDDLAAVPGLGAKRAQALHAQLAAAARPETDRASGS